MKIPNGNLTQEHHHVFWILDNTDDVWLQEHLRHMEAERFRVTAVVTTDSGPAVFMIR